MEKALYKCTTFFYFFKITQLCSLALKFIEIPNQFVLSAMNTIKPSSPMILNFCMLMAYNSTAFNTSLFYHTPCTRNTADRLKQENISLKLELEHLKQQSKGSRRQETYFKDKLRNQTATVSGLRDRVDRLQMELAESEQLRYILDNELKEQGRGKQLMTKPDHSRLTAELEEAINQATRRGVKLLGGFKFATTVSFILPFYHCGLYSKIQRFVSRIIISIQNIVNQEQSTI